MFSNKIRNAIKQASYPTKASNLAHLPDKITELIKHRNQTRKRWHLTQDPAVKRYLNYLNRKIKEEINEYRSECWDNTLQNLDLNHNTVWKIARSLRKSTNHIHPINHMGNLYQSETEIANVMAEELAKTFKPHPVTDHSFISFPRGRLHE